MNIEKNRYSSEAFINNWTKLEKDGNKIELEYWGRFVNIELRATCILDGAVWKVEDIYFQ